MRGTSTEFPYRFSLRKIFIYFLYITNKIHVKNDIGNVVLFHISLHYCTIFCYISHNYVLFPHISFYNILFNSFCCVLHHVLYYSVTCHLILFILFYPVLLLSLQSYSKPFHFNSNHFITFCFR